MFRIRFYFAVVMGIALVRLLDAEVVACATLTPMPTPRWGPPMVGVIDGRLHVVGGQFSSGCCSEDRAAHEIYDPATDSWTSAEPLLLPRSGGGAAVIDGKLYVVGGFNYTGLGDVDNLDRYDPATGWTSLAPMLFRLRQMSVAAIDGKLYVAGGTADALQRNVDTLQVYDPSSGWELKAPMPTAHAAMGAGVIDGKLYVPGGTVGSFDDAQAVGTLAVYDPVSDRWSTLAPMPRVKARAAVAVINRKLYVIGGAVEIFGPAEAMVYGYDPDTDTWTEQTPILTARYGMGVGVIDGRLHVVGGYEGIIHVSGVTLPTLEVCTPQPLSVPPVPTGLTGVLSGQGGVQLTWEDVDGETGYLIERRDSNACAWQPLDTVPANTTTYTNSQLPWSDQIYYRVAAQNVAGTSDWVESSIVSHPAVPRWQLMLFRPIGVDDGMWVPLRPCYTRFDPNFGTAVIVHGWNPPIIGGDQLNGWMRDIARLIHQRISSGVNVFAWEWIEEAKGLVDGRAPGNIDPQARVLAAALESAFGEGYGGPLHFIGHSLGSQLIIVTTLTLARHQSWTGILHKTQLTLLDTPDFPGVGIGDINRNIKDLRDKEVYVDSYFGCTNLGPHNANVWVDVPCISFDLCLYKLCHVATTSWYQGTTHLDSDAILRDGPSCGSGVLDGTVGFGLSILLTDPVHPNRFRPEYQGCGLEMGTLKFSELLGCTYASGVGVFGLDDARGCEEVKLPTLVPNPNPFSLGEFSDNCQFCELQTPEHFFLSTGVHLPGEGGGGQIDEIVVSFSLPLTISDEWDYLGFEYDFTEAAAEATLEASLTVGDMVYPLFLMISGPVLAEEFLDTGLRDIRDLHGQEAILTFDLRSAQPGAVVYVRNLTFWRDPWHGNHPPAANAGGDQEPFANVNGTAAVTLDGSATADDDGDTLTYQWMVAGELVATGMQSTVELLLGEYDILLVVRDLADAVSTDIVHIAVLPSPPSFLRGDSNTDGEVDISDAIHTLSFLFLGTSQVPCEDAADANDDGTVDISDAISTLGFLFLGMPPVIPAPYPTRGPDPTPDTRDCDQY